MHGKSDMYTLALGDTVSSYQAVRYTSDGTVPPPMDTLDTSLIAQSVAIAALLSDSDTGTVLDL